MKRHFALLACTIGIASLAHAQNCPTQALVFHYQWDVDEFATNYPSCTQLPGSLQIGLSQDGQHDGIFDLSSLSQLTSVGGDLAIYWTYGLQSLNGLNNLTSVGGDLRIDNAYGLADISALGNVTSIGGTLEIHQTGSLSSLSGLGSVAFIGGSLLVEANSLTSLHGLGPVAATGGKLSIRESLITDLQGLEGIVDIGGHLSLDANNSLVSMNGLAPSSVGGGLAVRNCPLLTDLSAATGLTSLGMYLNIQNNPSLSSLEELSGITSLGGYLRVQGSPLLTDISPVAGIDPASITQLRLEDLPGVSDCALASICGFLTRLDPDVVITNNAAGCASVAEVEAACGVTSIANVQSMAFDLFPNPTDGMVTIRGKFDGNSVVHVLDCAGRSVHEERVSAATEGSHTIDFSHLPPGVYTLRIQHGQSFSTTSLLRH